MLGAQGMGVSVLPLAMQRCCLAWGCSGGCCLYSRLKKPIGTSSFWPPETTLRGPGPPQGGVLVSPGVEDSRVPQDGTWLKLTSGPHGTRTGILAAMLHPPNLVIVELELRKLPIPLF